VSLLITHSRLACHRRCPREHHYRYDLGRVVRASHAQRLGTLVHLGLEAWWRAQLGRAMDDEGYIILSRAELADPATWVVVVSRLDRALSAMAHIEPAPDPYDLARAEAMLIGYDARWSADAQNYEVLAVEHEFRAPLPGRLEPLFNQGADLRGWQLGGKLDVLVRERSTGRVLVIEHKTSSEDISPGAAYWARLRLDGQVSLYHLADERVEAVLYDVLLKPSAKPHKATPEESRKWTKEKKGNCPSCGGMGATEGFIPSVCAACGGFGRLVLEPRRLYAGQRLTDESPADFRDRLVADIAAAPEKYYARGEVVRLASESAEHLAELREQAIAIARGSRVKNPESCVRYGSTCGYFGACTGERSIEEYEKIEWCHPELTAPAGAEEQAK